MPRSAGSGRSPTVFVSYRREDSGDVTGRIRDQIAGAFGDQHVYMDIDSIPLGVDFRDHLNASVAECDVVLAIIGKHWLTIADGTGERRIDNPSDFVRLELEAALERDIPVIPVLVLGADPLDPDALPDSLKPLAFRQATAVRRDPDFHADMRRLVDGLRGGAASGPSSAARPVTVERAARTTRTRRPVGASRGHLRTALIGAVALAVAGIAVAISRGGDAPSKSSHPPTSQHATGPTSSSAASAPESTDAPGATDTSFLVGQTGQVVRTRAYTLRLPEHWSTDGSGNATIKYLPDAVAVRVDLYGPYPSLGESLEYIAAQAAEGEHATTHSEITTSNLDGVEAREYTAVFPYATDVKVFALFAGKEYYFDLVVLKPSLAQLPGARRDLHLMLASLTWAR